MSYSRREFLAAATAAAAAATAAGAAQGDGEWRNKQSGMAYRRLGRTGYMVSEFICGGNTISPNKNDHVRLAIDMGLNYLDTAPAYGRGASEEGYSHIIKNSSIRQRVFMATKVSPWDINRNDVFQKMFDSLPAAEQQAVKREAEEYINASLLKTSDYFCSYFDQQWGEVERAAISNAMEKRYGSRLDKKKEYTALIIESVENSLRRLGTDHVDVLLCPHGASTPQEMNVPEIFEAFERLKKAGKARHLGFSSHSDPAGTLRAAAENGHYSMGMIAYNITNHGWVDEVVRQAKAKDMGVVAMKAARSVWSGRPNREAPPQRLSKLQAAVPGDMKIPMKAYAWVLRNPDITAINSEMENAEMVRDNLPLAGKKL